MTGPKQAFSFKDNLARVQPPEETMLIMTYELGRVIEALHKAKVYGKVQGYLGNGKKEMADHISMCRLLCEQVGWDYEELKDFGEECFLERMEDIRKYGVNPDRG